MPQQCHGLGVKGKERPEEIEFNGGKRGLLLTPRSVPAGRRLGAFHHLLEHGLREPVGRTAVPERRHGDVAEFWANVGRCLLAIGQLIEAREGKKLAEGNTATLELTPTQAEELAAANSRGEISLVLRSIADIKGGDENVNSQVKVMRYGSRSRASGASN